MKHGELGTLTTYDAEYVFDFLGKERILKQLDLLKNKAAMGIPFKDFLKGNGKHGYLVGKGIFHIYSIILRSYFPELDVAIFLYEKSKSIHEHNYYSGLHLRYHSDEFVAFIKRRISNNEGQPEAQEETIMNQYWKEYHFFILIIFSFYRKRTQSQLTTQWFVEVFSEYDKNIETITRRIKMDMVLWPENGLGNRMFSAIADHYRDIGRYEEANQLEAKYHALGWR